MRIWKTTLTFNPQEVFLIRTRAELKARKRGVAWGDLNEGEKFARLQAESGRYITLWLKRLRKAGHRFRYIAVAEAHKSGAPHYHMIIHELVAPIPKRVLETSWSVGFSKFRLVPAGMENRAVRYATKYVAKNGAARIRASIRYGVAGERGSDDVEERKAVPASVAGPDWWVFPKEKAAPTTKGGNVGPGTKSGLSESEDARVFLDHLDTVWPVQQKATSPPKADHESSRRGRKDRWEREAFKQFSSGRLP